MTRNALIDPKIQIFYKKLICYQNAKFYKPRKKNNFFLNFVTSLWPYRSSEVKGQGAKWKPRYDFLSKVNSKYVPIWYRFQDIGPF